MDNQKAANIILERIQKEENLELDTMNTLEINALKRAYCKLLKDAVPVVRCRECEFYDQLDTDDIVKSCTYWKSFMPPSGYCSIGKRREDGDT